MNNPVLVMDLLENNKYMTIRQNKAPRSKEHKITFEQTDEEIFLYDIIIERLTKGSRKINIPLDFDEVEGFDDLLRLITAFTYPGDNIIFKIYKTEDSTFESEHTTPSHEKAMLALEKPQCSCPNCGYSA